jgi:uncharacterized protein YggE
MDGLPPLFSGMTPLHRLTTIAALLVAVSCPALAQQFASPPPLVTTHGSAEIRVVPDLADLQFEVGVRNVDLAAGRKEQADRTAKVLAALRAAGVADTELQSSQTQIVSVYPDRREAEKVKYYTITQQICCTLHDVKAVPDVTASAVNAGASAVMPASLRTSQLRKYRDEARGKAIHAAKEKAVALAAELGSKVGKPFSISEGGYSDWRSNMNGNNIVQVAATEDEGHGEVNSPTFAAGTISISANITVAFLLE